jgi:hypothetical protein
MAYIGLFARRVNPATGRSVIGALLQLGLYEAANYPKLASSSDTFAARVETRQAA